MEKTVTIQRINSQRNGDDKIKGYVLFIVEKIIGKNSKWSCEPNIVHASAPCDSGFATLVELKFAYKGNSTNVKQIWDNMYPELKSICTLPRWNAYPWKIIEDTKDIAQVHEEDKSAEDRPRVEPISLEDIDFSDERIKEHTGHIYDREDQIFIAAAAMRSAIMTEMRIRHHCVLHGDPGCGKSAIIEGLASTLGEEEEAYIKFDATSMTSAGAIKKLMEDSHPPLLIIEEIEKTSVENLRWLLGVLDTRAELRKTNFRGHNRVSCKMICLATVNDMNLFNSVMSGALASRFSHEIYCPRPDRKVMELILNREVAKIAGDLKWVEPTLQLCYDEWKVNDPRKVIPVCMSGREHLLDGSFQRRLKRLRKLQEAA